MTLLVCPRTSKRELWVIDRDDSPLAFLVRVRHSDDQAYGVSGAGGDEQSPGEGCLPLPALLDAHIPHVPHM